MDHLDHQLQWSSPWTDGLKRLKRDEEENDGQSWRTWPHLQIATDMGSDMMASHRAAMHFFKLNYGVRPDTSHGAARDFDLALGGNGLRGFWQTMAISWNLRHGLDDEETRNAGVCDAMHSVFTNYDTTTPLFVSMLPRLIRMFQKLGYEFEADNPMDEQVWTFMKALCTSRPLGKKCVMARFQSSLSTGMERRKWWALDTFERTFLALGTDVLRGKAFLEKFQLNLAEGDEVGEGGATTNLKRVTKEAKSMLGACQQAVAMSVTMLDGVVPERLVATICTIAEELRFWHQHQASELRSADGNAMWSMEQIVNDKYYDHVNKILERLHAPSHLLDMGFVCDHTAAARCCEHEELAENDFAALAWDFAWSLASCRCRRGLWMRGWPTKLLKLLGSPAQATQVQQDLKQDWDVWLDFVDAPATCDAVNSLKQRHRFQLIENQQFISAFLEVGFDGSNPTGLAEIKHLLTQRSRLPWSSHFSEDTIGSMKNRTSKKNKGTRKFSKMETVFVNAIRGKVLEKRNHYRTVRADRPLMSKMDRLPLSAYKAGKATRSLPFEKIVSTSQAPAYDSPSASNWMCPVMDLVHQQTILECCVIVSVFDRLCSRGLVLASACGVACVFVGCCDVALSVRYLWCLPLFRLCDSCSHQSVLVLAAVCVCVCSGFGFWPAGFWFLFFV